MFRLMDNMPIDLDDPLRTLARQREDSRKTADPRKLRRPIADHYRKGVFMGLRKPWAAGIASLAVLTGLVMPLAAMQPASATLPGPVVYQGEGFDTSSPPP